MSALGHLRTSIRLQLMSAFHPKADIHSTADNVRFVPKSDVRAAAKAPLFDDLVRGREQLRRHGYVEHPGGLEIEGKRELRGEFHREVAGFFATQDSCGVCDKTGKPFFRNLRIPDQNAGRNES